MVDLNHIREHILSRLGNELPASLTYHNLEHTIDVEKQCMIIAKEEDLNDDQTLLELRIAALYHDSGFLYVYKGHEEKSCELAKIELTAFGVNKEAIDNICEIIAATKIPQSPKTLSQKIICDADLDYLGRDDYFIINEKLHKEFLEYAITPTEEIWKSLRIAFMRSHTYFTKYSQKKRAQKKQEHLNYLLSLK